MASKIIVERVVAALIKYIYTRDKRLTPYQPWSPNPMAQLFNKLLEHGSVTVGGRSTCGGSVDQTWRVFCSWNEVVAKAVKLGYDITETHIKQDNAWATKAGGFWHEREYRLKRNGE